MKMIEYYYCVSFLEPPGGGGSVLILLLAPLVACINTSAMATSVNSASVCFFIGVRKSERPFDFIRKKTFNLPVVEAYGRPRHSPLILVCTSFDDH